MAVDITIRFAIGDKEIMVSSPPKAIAMRIEKLTGGRLAELVQKIADGGLELVDVMAILGVFERDPKVLTYLEKVIAADGEAEATAREAVTVLVMVASGAAAQILKC